MRILILLLAYLSSLDLYTQVVTASNMKPKRGQTVSITYFADSSDFSITNDELYVQLSAHFEDYGSAFERKKMKKVGGRFLFELKIDSNASFYEVSFFDRDKYDQENSLEIGPTNEDGEFFRNYYMGYAYSDAFAAEKERQHFPYNFALDVSRWRNLEYEKNKDSVRNVIRGELQHIENRVEAIASGRVKTASLESAYYALSLGHVILEDFKQAYHFYDLLLANHPQSPLIESAHTLYSYYLFSLSKADQDFETRSMEFFKQHPTSPIAKRLIWQLDQTEKERAVMRISSSYWMEQEPDEVVHLIMQARSYTDPDLKRKYLGLALNKLLDEDLSITHYYTWDERRPGRLRRIIEGYYEAGSYGEALGLISLMQANSSRFAAEIFEIKARVYLALNNFQGAFESYVMAESQGSKIGGDSARSIFAKVNAKTDFESYKEQINRKIYFEADVSAAPDFELQDIVGNRYVLSNLKGKVVVINFWFIACAPCRVEMPGLNELVQKYKDQEVVFLALALDSKESLLRFLQEKDFGYQIVASSRKIAEKFEVTGYPTHFILDKDGNIRSEFVGGSEERHLDLIPAIDDALKY